MTGTADMMVRTCARQEIEYLRRLYAKATDLIGTGKAEAVAEGTAIYEQIFTADVSVRTAGGIRPLTATGPQGWADVVQKALANYSATQHLIGTQLVDPLELASDADGVVLSGSARMESYLQAWHEHPNGTVYVFLGTYEDQVRYDPAHGWQIYDMTLVQTSSENREMGTL